MSTLLTPKLTKTTVFKRAAFLTRYTKMLHISFSRTRDKKTEYHADVLMQAKSLKAQGWKIIKPNTK